MSLVLGTSSETPFESAQVIIQDESGRLFFHRNSSIEAGKTKTTFFGGKVEENDNNAFQRAISEVREEASVALLPQNLKKICEDGPQEFEKGWFLAHIYYALVSTGTGDMFASHPDTVVLENIKDFEQRGPHWQWQISFEHTKGLINRIISHG